MEVFKMDSKIYLHIRENIDMTDKGIFVIIPKKEFYTIITLSFILGLLVMSVLLHFLV